MIDGSTSNDLLKIFFKIEELGFFDPKLPIKYGFGNIMKFGKDTIYRNVHLFIQRINNITSFKGDKTVNHNLSLYLRKAALE